MDYTGITEQGLRSMRDTSNDIEVVRNAAQELARRQDEQLLQKDEQLRQLRYVCHSLECWDWFMERRALACISCPQQHMWVHHMQG
jgi:hypothetical protein